MFLFTTSEQGRVVVSKMAAICNVAHCLHVRTADGHTHTAPNVPPYVVCAWVVVSALGSLVSLACSLVTASCVATGTEE